MRLSFVSILIAFRWANRLPLARSLCPLRLLRFHPSVVPSGCDTQPFLDACVCPVPHRSKTGRQPHICRRSNRCAACMYSRPTQLMCWQLLHPTQTIIGLRSAYVPVPIALLTAVRNSTALCRSSGALVGTRCFNIDGSSARVSVTVSAEFSRSASEYDDMPVAHSAERFRARSNCGRPESGRCQVFVSYVAPRTYTFTTNGREKKF